MRVIEQKKNELVLIDQDNQVLAVPNTFYFFLKYSIFEGKEISYVINTNPKMIVREIKEQDFLCIYNKMRLKVTEKDQIDELCRVLLECNKTKNQSAYINFFAENFAKSNSYKILENIFKQDLQRIEFYGYPELIIDDMFAINNQQIFVRDHKDKKSSFPWDKLKLTNKEFEKYKIIKSHNGRDLILDKNMQVLISNISFLLGVEKKSNVAFMGQLSPAIQKWVEKGKYNEK